MNFSDSDRPRRKSAALLFLLILLISGLAAGGWYLRPRFESEPPQIVFKPDTQRECHEKAGALRAVLAGKRDPDCFPAQVVRPRDGEILWLVDRAAANGLDERAER